MPSPGALTTLVKLLLLNRGPANDPDRQFRRLENILETITSRVAAEANSTLTVQPEGGSSP
jgi:hypothetical protein